MSKISIFFFALNISFCVKKRNIFYIEKISREVKSITAHDLEKELRPAARKNKHIFKEYKNSSLETMEMIDTSSKPILKKKDSSVGSEDEIFYYNSDYGITNISFLDCKNREGIKNHPIFSPQVSPFQEEEDSLSVNGSDEIFYYNADYGITNISFLDCKKREGIKNHPIFSPQVSPFQEEEDSSSMDSENEIFYYNSDYGITNISFLDYRSREGIITHPLYTPPLYTPIIYRLNKTKNIVKRILKEDEDEEISYEENQYFRQGANKKPVLSKYQLEYIKNIANQFSGYKKHYYNDMSPVQALEYDIRFLCSIDKMSYESSLQSDYKVFYDLRKKEAFSSGVASSDQEKKAFSIISRIARYKEIISAKKILEKVLSFKEKNLFFDISTMPFLEASYINHLRSLMIDLEDSGLYNTENYVPSCSLFIPMKKNKFLHVKETCNSELPIESQLYQYRDFNYSGICLFNERPTDSFCPGYIPLTTMTTKKCLKDVEICLKKSCKKPLKKMYKQNYKKEEDLPKIEMYRYFLKQENKKLSLVKEKKILKEYIDTLTKEKVCHIKLQNKFFSDIMFLENLRIINKNGKKKPIDPFQYQVAVKKIKKAKIISNVQMTYTRTPLETQNLYSAFGSKNWNHDFSKNLIDNCCLTGKLLLGPVEKLSCSLKKNFPIEKSF